MPKISAATVPEHREAQRKVILSAARNMILEGGVSSLKFGDLAERAGLARPSVYEYFRTKSDLVIALIEEEGPSWKSEVSIATAQANSPEESLAAFVRTILKLVSAGRHELPFALANGDIDDRVRLAIASAHRDLFLLIMPALKDLGVSDPGAGVELIGGVVAAAGQALRRSRKRASIIGHAVEFAIGGAKALASRR